jgi:hypothetical protein
MYNNQTRTESKNNSNENTKSEVIKTVIVLEECKKKFEELDNYLSFENDNQSLFSNDSNFDTNNHNSPAISKASFEKKQILNTGSLNFEESISSIDLSSILDQSKILSSSNSDNYNSENEIENMMDSKLMEIELEGLLEDTVLEEEIKGVNLSPLLNEDDVLASNLKKQSFDIHLRLALLSLNDELTSIQLSQLSDFVWSGLKLVSVSRQT